MNRANQSLPKTSIAISLMLLTFFTCQWPAQAQSLAHFQEPTKEAPALAMPALIGTIKYPDKPGPSFKDLQCDDFTVVIKIEDKVEAELIDKHFSSTRTKLVTSVKAGMSNQQCSYKVGGLPLKQSLRIELRIPKFPTCDYVTLDYTYWPIKRTETITFYSDKTEKREFTVKSLKCGKNR